VATSRVFVVSNLFWVATVAEASATCFSKMALFPSGFTGAGAFALASAAAGSA